MVAGGLFFESAMEASGFCLKEPNPMKEYLKAVPHRSSSKRQPFIGVRLGTNRVLGWHIEARAMRVPVVRFTARGHCGHDHRRPQPPHPAVDRLRKLEHIIAGDVP